jgi:hypothetical protein
MANATLLRTPEQEREKADLIFEHLVNTVQMFNKYKIDFVCIDGTALGLYRNRDIILGDSDFDLGIIYNEHNINAVKRMLMSEDARIFTAHKRTNPLSCKMFVESPLAFINDSETLNFHEPYSLKINMLKDGKMTKQKVFGDAFILYDPAVDFIGCDKSDFPDNSYVYTLYCGDSVKFLSVPKNLVSTSDSININGNEFPIPRNIEDYLTYTYTETWSTPIRYARIPFRWPVHIRMKDEKFLNVMVRNRLKQHAN